MVIAHAVRHHRRHQRLNRAQHRDREGGTKQAVNEISAEVRNREVGQPARNSSEACANSFDRQVERDHRDRARQHCHDRSGNAVRNRTAYQHRHERTDAQNRCRV